MTHVLGSRSTIPGISRRQFIATSIAGGTALALGGRNAFAQAGITLKVGFVSPRTGPLAGFGQTDGYVLDLAARRWPAASTSAARNTASKSSTRIRNRIRPARASWPRT